MDSDITFYLMVWGVWGVSDADGDVLDQLLLTLFASTTLL